MRFLTIGKNDDNQRLDRFLGKYLPGAPKSLVQKWIRTKKIKLNKSRAEAESILHEGDEVQIYLYDEVLKPYERDLKRKRSLVKLDYVYSDGSIAIIDKPKGLLTHAANGKDYGKNVVDAFVDDLIDSGEYVPRLEQSFRPAVVNRLDFNTEGLIVGVKTHEASMEMNEAIVDGRIRKKYRAICLGVLKEEQTISLDLVKEGNRMKIASDGEGIRAVTIVRPIRSGKDWTEIDVELLTGRFHQIRAHLSGIGHPLAGDGAYGGRKGRFSRIESQLLIAYRLEFGEMKTLTHLNHRIFESKRLSGWRRTVEAEIVR